MRKVLEKGLALLHFLENGLLVGLLVAMIGIAVTQIVMRNGFDSGFLWADSLLRVLVLWIGMIGALVAVGTSAISVSILPGSTFRPGRPRASRYSMRCLRR